MTAQKLPRKGLTHWISWCRSFFISPKKLTTNQLLAPYLQETQATYNANIEQTESIWSLSRYRWRFDEKTKQLIFEHKKAKLPTLVAEAQILGSYFIDAREWHWAWSTPHIPKKAAKDARKLRHFGRCYKLTYLYTNPVELQGHPHYPQLLAALGHVICQSDSVYTGISKQQTVVFLLRNIRKA